MALIPMLSSIAVVVLVFFAYTSGLPAMAGPAPSVIAPTLTNRSLDEAREIARRQGLDARVAVTRSAEAPRDHVLEQDPPPGTRLEPGEAIDLTLSSGLKPPNVVGKTLDQARVDLVIAGWKPAAEVEVRPGAGPPNVVVAQQPGPNETVDSRGAIQLVIAQPDLAFNKRTLTSAGQPAPEAVDGNEGTVASVGGNPPRWLEIDFGGPVTVSAVNLKPSLQQPSPVVVELWAWDASGRFFPLRLIATEARPDTTLEAKLDRPVEGVVRLRAATTVGPPDLGWRTITVLDR
jgi:hypothetical protein